MEAQQNVEDVPLTNAAADTHEGDIGSPSVHPAEEEAAGASPTKKLRRRRRGTNAPKERSPSCLDKVPFEILAEILSYTASPRDILALARCSKYFCATLTNKRSSYIWRQARARCEPHAIPDPTPNYTESAYAAFIFDHGDCEVCGKKTKEPYWSFSLKAHLCEKKSCRDKFQTQSLFILSEESVPDRYKHLISSVPYSERNGNLYQVRRKVWDATLDEYERATLSDAKLYQFTLAKQEVARKIPDILKLARQLVNWRDKWKAARSAKKNYNDTIAQGIADGMGWTQWDLMQTDVFGTMHRSKVNCLEEITKHDFELIRDEVERQYLQNVEARERRVAERAYQKRREDVAKHYERLKSQGQSLPTLPEFRQLSMMKVMQYKPSDEVVGIRKDLNDSKLVEVVLKDDLAKWQERARADLATILGFPKYRNANKNKLHPVDRLTARFKCKKCDKEATNHRDRQIESLDFAGACGHQCQHLSKRQRAREGWNAEQFEPDHQVIDAVNEVLRLCKADAADEESLHVVEALGSKIVCLSCTAPIVMNLKTLIRHCKRHDVTQLFLLTEDDADIMLRAPFEYGKAAELLSSTPDAAAKRDLKIYGCRHCQQSRLYKDVTAAGPSVDTSAVGDRGQSSKQSENNGLFESRQAKRAASMGRKLYNFNGLRSHLKEKHNVTHIGDEDFFCQQGSSSGDNGEAGGDK